MTEMNISFKLFFFGELFVEAYSPEWDSRSEVGNCYLPCSVFPDFSMKPTGNVRVHSYFPIAPPKLALSFKFFLFLQVISIFTSYFHF